MLVNGQTIAAVFKTLNVIFNQAFDGAPSQWQSTAMLVPSGASQNTYAWLSMFPRMRKWIGDKVIKELEAFGYTIINDDWEATIEVKRNDIEDDQVGIYGPQAQMAGYSAKQLPDEIISDLKNQAFTSKCYDGKNFYDANHRVGTENVSNKSSEVLSEASYSAARIAIMNQKDDDGRSLGLVPDILEVPPALEAQGRVLLEADILSEGMPNPYKGTAKLLVNQRLTSSTAWFLHATSMPVKPFIYQERKKPVFVEQTDVNSDHVFLRGIYRYGAEARAAGGYGFWQMSFGSTGTGN